MQKGEIEQQLLQCIKENLEESKNEIPTLEANTEIFTAIDGFDSLRAIEILIKMESVLGCELPFERVFNKKPAGSDKICDAAEAIYSLVHEA